MMSQVTPPEPGDARRLVVLAGDRESGDTRQRVTRPTRQEPPQCKLSECIKVNEIVIYK